MLMMMDAETPKGQKLHATVVKMSVCFLDYHRKLV